MGYVSSLEGTPPKIQDGTPKMQGFVDVFPFSKGAMLVFGDVDMITHLAKQDNLAPLFELTNYLYEKNRWSHVYTPCTWRIIPGLVSG